MQKFKFPMRYLRVTQKELSTYSHAGSFAIDFGGKDTGSDKLYCPCDMIVKRRRQNATGELYMESIEPVLFADGTSDYARLLCIHDGEFNVHEGQIVMQGEHFYDEGGMGFGNPNQFAIHVHIEAGKGKWENCSQFKNSQGTYVCENQAHLYDLFILDRDVQILNDGGYKWIREGEEKEMDNVRYGVDLSDNRSTGAMAKIVANGKAEFVIHRACVGSAKVDKNLEQYLKDTGDLKVGFFPANYFINAEDAKAEANYIIDTIENFGFTPEKLSLPVFCDWEGFSYDYCVNQGVIPTPELVRAMTEAYCEQIKARGYATGVYTNKNYWDNWYGQAFFDAHPDYYIWYARPGLSAPDRDCYIWQYASDDGADFGLAGEPLDKNILYGEYLSGWQIFHGMYKVTKSNCEYFSTTDVNAPLGKLTVDTTYNIKRISGGEINNFKWAEIEKDGTIVYVVILEDRCEIIQVIETPALPEQQPCDECEELRCAINDLSAQVEALEDKCAEYEKGAEIYAQVQAEVDRLNEQLASVQTELTMKIAAYEIVEEINQDNKAKISILESSNTELNEKIVKLEGDKAALEAKNAELQSALDFAAVTCEQAIQSVENLKRAREELIVERDALKAEIERFKGEQSTANTKGFIRILEQFLNWLKGE